MILLCIKLIRFQHTCRWFDVRARDPKADPYIHMQTRMRVAVSTTEGALHDVNYPEMQEAEEERKKGL